MECKGKAMNISLFQYNKIENKIAYYADNAYKTKDRVRFEGKIYKSLIDGNAYSSTSWKEVK